MIDTRATKLSFGPSVTSNSQVVYRLNGSITDTSDSSVTAPFTKKVPLNSDGDALVDLPITLSADASPYAVGISVYEHVNDGYREYVLDIPTLLEDDSDPLDLSTLELRQTNSILYGVQSVSNTDPFLTALIDRAKLYVSHNTQSSVTSGGPYTKFMVDAAGHLTSAQYEDFVTRSEIAGIIDVVAEVSSHLADTANIGDTSLEASGIPSSIIGSSGSWVIIEPYSVNCEIRRVVSALGSTLVIDTPLENMHVIGTALLFTHEPLFSFNLFGAFGDGVNDDWAGITAAIAAAPSGSTLDGEGLRYRVTGQITWDKLLHLRRATFIEDAALLAQNIPLDPLVGVPLIYLKKTNDISASGSHIEAVRIEGAETRDTFNWDDSNRDGIRVTDCSDVSITDVWVQGKSYGVKLELSEHCRVDSLTFIGLFSELIEESHPGRNYHSGCRTRGGAGHIISRLMARGSGSGILLGGPSTNVHIEGPWIENVHDNGIYVSGNDRTTITGGMIDTVYNDGTGIKVRGSENVVVGNTVRNVGLGITLSGYNVTQIGQTNTTYTSSTITSGVTTITVADGTNFAQGKLLWYRLVNGNWEVQTIVSRAGNVITINGAIGGALAVSTINPGDPIYTGPANEDSLIDGVYTVCEGNVLEGCTRDGILLSSVATSATSPPLYMRNVIIANNIIANTASEGGSFAAIRGTAYALTIRNNQIKSCGGTTGAFILSGTLNQPLTSLVVEGNSVRGVQAASTSRGMSIDYSTNANISNNIFREITNLCIVGTHMTNCNFIGNNGTVSCPAGVLWLPPASPEGSVGSSGNLVAYNRGVSISIDHLNNTVSHNDYDTDHDISTGRYKGAGADLTDATIASILTMGGNFSSTSAVNLNGPTGTDRHVGFYENNLLRWLFQLGVTGSPVGATATATATITSGVVTALTPVVTGNNYVITPTVNISGGGGRGALYTANLSGGSVVSYNKINGGVGYTTTPTVTVAAPIAIAATGTAVLSGGSVASITVNNPGMGYTTSPTVTLSGGGGSGASFTAVTNYSAGPPPVPGSVTAFTLVSGGTLYTTPPTVIITGGFPDVGAQLQFNSRHDDGSSDMAFINLIRSNHSIQIGDTVNLAFSQSGTGSRIGLTANDRIAFFGQTPAARPALTYSRSGESTAAAALRTALVALGLVTDSTTA